MKIHWNSKYNTAAVYMVLVVAVSLVLKGILENTRYFIGVLDMICGLLTPFICGFVIAYLLNPVLRVIEGKMLLPLFRRQRATRGIRALGVLLTMIVAAAALGLFGRVVVPEVINSIVSIGTQLPEYVRHLEAFLIQLTQQMGEIELTQTLVGEVGDMIETLWDKASGYVSQILPHLFSFTVNVTSAIFNLIMGIIISIYILMSKEIFMAQSKKLLCSIFKPEQVQNIVAITHESNAIFSGFIGGKILDSAIIGVLCFIGMSIFDMPYTMLISVIVGVTNIIPYFGPFIGAIPSVLLLLMVDPMEAVWFSLFILALQQFDGNILGPWILGDSTGLSAFWVIFAITVFGTLLGPVGMFLGVPIFAVVYSLIRKGCEARLIRRELSPETADYASEKHPLLGTAAKKEKKRRLRIKRP